MTLLRRHALTAYALLVVGYLMLPIAVVILFSFNDPIGRFNYVWQGFTLDNWVEWDASLGLRDSVLVSLQLGLLDREDRCRDHPVWAPLHRLWSCAARKA